MNLERSTFLALLCARTEQRCPGKMDSVFDLDGGHVTVGCTRCAAVLQLPLRQPLRPDPEPPIRESHLQRVTLWILDAAWCRWRTRFTRAGATGWGSHHMPVEWADDAVPSTERAA